ncbi:MAG: response regulator transcription factor [Elusimicrobiota bacterium]
MTRRQEPSGISVLVVDDDPSVLQSVSSYLKAHGFNVVTAREGSAAYAIIQEVAPQVIVTDAEMPGMDGIRLCRLLKKDARTRSIPVILMSGARIGETDQICGFDSGADDYILKPFSFKVLLARVHAVLRRFEQPGEGAEILKTCGLQLDPAGRTVSVRGAQVKLTRKEFDLLMSFMRQPDRVLQTRHLLESVWGYDLADYNDPHTVEVHVSSLRKKLGPEVGRRLVSVTGYGYKFEAQSADSGAGENAPRRNAGRTTANGKSGRKRNNG